MLAKSFAFACQWSRQSNTMYIYIKLKTKNRSSDQVFYLWLQRASTCSKNSKCTKTNLWAWFSRIRSQLRLIMSLFLTQWASTAQIFQLRDSHLCRRQRYPRCLRSTSMTIWRKKRYARKWQRGACWLNTSCPCPCLPIRVLRPTPKRNPSKMFHQENLLGISAIFLAKRSTNRVSASMACAFNLIGSFSQVNNPKKL